VDSQRILIVEPARAVANAMASVLGRRGYEVVVARSCAETNRHPRRFACGVFALDLPDGNGIALAGWLLAENRIDSAVFFDDASDVELRLRASNLGSFVHRSEGLHELGKTIEEAIAETRHARAVGDEAGGSLRAQLKSGPRRRR
jgi:DNA-binding response OmpR family regulator